MASASVSKMATMFLLVLTLGHLMAADASLHHQDARRLLAQNNDLSLNPSLSEAARVVVGQEQSGTTTGIPTNAGNEPLCPCWPACC
ncbi:hypothetical protein QOZ80_5BG0440300 [Eleusine coracana subsp. coracana]|nr:hypothetical protein QOZ80_5BG0440300 [Eleusine coracana subsp. coracana]